MRGQLVLGQSALEAGIQFLIWLSQRACPTGDHSATRAACGCRNGATALAIMSASWPVCRRITRQNAGNVTGMCWVSRSAAEIAIAAHGKLWKAKPVNYSLSTQRRVLPDQQILMGAEK